jgi:hypothetical protein
VRAAPLRTSATDIPRLPPVTVKTLAPMRSEPLDDFLLHHRPHDQKPQLGTETLYFPARSLQQLAQRQSAAQATCSAILIGLSKNFVVSVFQGCSPVFEVYFSAADRGRSAAGEPPPFSTISGTSPRRYELQRHIECGQRCFGGAIFFNETSTVARRGSSFSVMAVSISAATALRAWGSARLKEVEMRSSEPTTSLWAVTA